MKLRVLISMFILILALSACNLPSNTPTPTPTLSLTPSATPSPTATSTATPSNTPPPTATFTPTVPIAYPKDQNVNCRLGPGIEWLSLSGLNVGTSSQIVGKSGDGGWWYIVDPLNSARKCWVATSVTNTAGNLSVIPIAESPKASVTDVEIDVKPKTINATACPGAGSPIEFAGTIETNGPTNVQWYFETEQSGPLTTNTTKFDSSGKLDFSTNYTPLLGAGTYWVRLVITSPNDMQAETQYTIKCP